MNNLSVLIVEDDEPTRSELFRFFLGRGWDVVATGTADQALELLDPPPTSLILGLELPDGDGETVLRAVRAGGLPTRVAVCAVAPDFGRMADLGPWGPDAVLCKPAPLADVYRACEPGAGVA